ncbi:MAG: hypothetical protein U0531_05535 [Dehalococcoidia bacterium]
MAGATALGQVEVSRKGERTPAGQALHFLQTLARRKPVGFVGLLFIAGMITVAVFPDRFATHAPAETNVAPRFQQYCVGPSDSFLCPARTERSPLTGELRTFEGSLSQPLGTDQLGRDIYSRIIHGTRVSAYVGFGAVLVSSLVALLIGVTCGYFGGRYDAAAQRVVDAVMALPTLVTLLALPMMIGGPTFTKLIVILGVLAGAGSQRDPPP